MQRIAVLLTRNRWLRAKHLSYLNRRLTLNVAVLSISTTLSETCLQVGILSRSGTAFGLVVSAGRFEEGWESMT